MIFMNNEQLFHFGRSFLYIPCNANNQWQQCDFLSRKLFRAWCAHGIDMYDCVYVRVSVYIVKLC